MVIHGKERKFKLTVGASVKIAELCPDGELCRIEELLRAPYAAATTSIMQIIAEMNRGYEEAKSYEEPGYAADPITVKELETLTAAELLALQTEALRAFRGDSTPTVEVEPDKNAKKKENEIQLS